MLLIKHPFDANDYQTDVGTWTVQAGDIHGYSYAVEGDWLFLRWSVNDTILAGSPKILILKLPATVPAPLERQGPLLESAFLNGGGRVSCYIESEIGQPHILIKRMTNLFGLIPFANGGFGGGFCVFFPLT